MLATLVGSLVGAGLFRLSVDWLFGLEMPETHGSAVDELATTIMWFVAVAFLGFLLLLALPTAATAVMLRLVEADRIDATVGWGLLGYVAFGYVAQAVGVRVPPDAALVLSFTGTRVVLERRRPSSGVAP